MKSIHEALGAMMPSFQPVGVERVSLADADGRVLADPVLARSSLPPFSNSAMDGFALRAADIALAAESSPVQLRVVAESRAGGEAPPALGAGEAIRIFTGAVMPDGADAVVMQEQARLEGAQVDILCSAGVGANVRALGSDLRKGEVMIEAGRRLGPGEIGLLAAQRIGAVSVRRRPRVAILSTGDELRDITEAEEPGTIVNSNAYALAAQVREAGGIPEVMPNVPDELELTVQRVAEGLRADLLITCGGVSVGDYDLVKEAFDRNGVSANFWKVRVKPGKPLSFGVKDGTPVVGLPGNPVSAMVTFEIFVRPGLRRMAGDAKPHRVALPVRLAHPHRHSVGRPELARARMSFDGETWVAHMHRLQGSGSLPSMVGIDGLVYLEAERAEFEAGEVLSAILLRNDVGAEHPPFEG